MSDKQSFKNKLNFKDRLEQELKGVTFSEANKKKVLQEVGKPQSRLRTLMEREILIPVRPLAAAVFIAAAGLIYALSASLAVSGRDIEKSKIVIVDDRDGGQQNNGYKN